MTQFERPVRADVLLQTAEFNLHPPGEVHNRVGSCSDEGAGTAFDNAFPWAYVERTFEINDDAPDPLAWFEDRLRDLGWAREGSESHGMHSWTRGSDESITLTVWGRPSRDVPQRFLDAAIAAFGDDHPPPSGRRSFRLSLQVDGTWPDGSSEPRFG